MRWAEDVPVTVESSLRGTDGKPLETTEMRGSPMLHALVGEGLRQGWLKMTARKQRQRWHWYLLP